MSNGWLAAWKGCSAVCVIRHRTPRRDADRMGRSQSRLKERLPDHSLTPLAFAGGFLAQSWSLLSGRMNLSAGGRWDHHSIDGVTAFSPQTSFSFSPLSSMSLRLGWGQYVQYPEISQLTSNLGSRDLLPMRSTQMIGAVEQRIGHRARVRAEFYNQRA